MATNTMYDAPIDTPDYADDVGGIAFGMDGGDTLREKSADLRGAAADKLRGFADTGKQQVANSLDGLVTAAREIAARMQDGSYGPIGGYATTAADTLEGWVRTVRDKSVDELVDDGRELVRTSPAIAVGAAVAAGFVLSRFLKASGGRAT
jgi:hypothetical protein